MHPIHPSQSLGRALLTMATSLFGSGLIFLGTTSMTFAAEVSSQALSPEEIRFLDGIAPAPGESFDVLLPNLGYPEADLSQVDLSPNACIKEKAEPVSSSSGVGAFLGELCKGGCLPLPCGSITVNKITVAKVTGGFQPGGDNGCGALFSLASWATIADKVATTIPGKIGTKSVGCLKLSASKPCECADQVKAPFNQTFKQFKLNVTHPDHPTCKFWVQADWTVTGVISRGKCSPPSLISAPL